MKSHPNSKLKVQIKRSSLLFALFLLLITNVKSQTSTTNHQVVIILKNVLILQRTNASSIFITSTLVKSDASVVETVKPKNIISKQIIPVQINPNLIKKVPVVTSTEA